jgi:hypothetical protein
MTDWYPHVRGHRSLWHLLQPDEPNKLIRRNSTQDTSGLYDLIQDPTELSNVYNNAQRAEVGADLKRRLMDWCLISSDVTPLEKSLWGHPR